MTHEKHPIVLLDGGMGQELAQRSSRSLSPLWSAQVMLDEPHLVTAVHRDFFEAGARVITVNSYSATPQRLARDGDPGLFEPLQAAALNAAREVMAVGAERVLVNCSVPERVTTAMGELAGLGMPFGGYANAFISVAPLHPGGTVDALESRTDLDPAASAEHALTWVERGATMVGGCCEVGPAHIAALGERLTAGGYRLVAS